MVKAWEDEVIFSNKVVLSTLIDAEYCLDGFTVSKGEVAVDEDDLVEFSLYIKDYK